MPTLRSALESAASRGLIDSAKLDALETHLLAELPALGPVPAAAEPELGSVVVETETPRFIRGFHDVLITLGVVVLLVGVGGVGAIIGMLPVIIILAEILVVRQRLALPAVALTIAMGIWTVFICHMLVDAMSLSGDGFLIWAFEFSSFPLIMLAFYWRYRIPLALATIFLSFFGILVLLLLGLLEIGLKSQDILTDHPALSLSLGIAAALGLFAVAMTYDLSDPARLSRRSDIAFWLHLVAAPALLYAGLATIFLVLSGSFAHLDGQMNAVPTPAVIGLVALLMLIGVVIDRRAFVTSGLLTLIVTVTAVLRKTQMEIEAYNVIFLALITVGVIVLTVGIGWQPLRRFIVGAFPPSVQTKLPPLH